MKLRKPSKQEFIKDGKRFFIAAPLLGLFLFVTNQLFGGNCWLRLITGIPCPACGFTRACLLLLKGDVAGAWHMHAMVIPVIFGVILFCFCKYFLENGRKIWQSYGIILVTVAVIYYIWRMVQYFPRVNPMIYYQENWLAAFIHRKH